MVAADRPQWSSKGYSAADLENIWRTGLITHGRCQLEYKVLDHPGKPWVVFLHGFGQNYRAFEPVYEKWEGCYSFLALHIFFHGESQLDGKQPLQMKEWAELVKALLSKMGIEKAHWLGYSMGAKFTLAAFQLFPQGFLSITLLAPDGLVMNNWYRLATRSVWGRLVLKILLQYLPFLRHIVLLPGKAGILPKSLGRFAESQLHTRESRRQVLNTWLNFRAIWPDANIWHRNLPEEKGWLRVITGHRDAIIPTNKFRHFRQRYPGIDWQEIKSGHGSIIEKWAEGMPDSGFLPENFR